MIPWGWLLKSVEEGKEVGKEKISRGYKTKAQEIYGGSNRSSLATVFLELGHVLGHRAICQDVRKSLLQNVAFNKF